MDQSFMKERKILPLVLSMSLPMVISMAVNSLYNIVDSYFVAKLSEDAMTALALVYPVQNLILSIGVGFGIGINASTAFYLGANDRARANSSVSWGIGLSVLHGLVLTVLCIMIIPGFLNMFTDDSHVIELGLCYSYRVFMFATVISVGIGFEKIFQSVGMMKTSMVSMMLGFIVNIILDPLMIFGIGIFPRMEMAGAAYATVIGQSVSLGVYVVVYAMGKLPISIGAKHIKADGKLVARLYTVGIPATLNMALPSLLISSLNGILAGFSAVYVLVLGVYYKLQTFIYLTANGIIQGIRPLVSYNYGAGETRRVRSIVNVTLKLTAGVMAVGTAISWIIPEFLMGLFTASEQTAEIGVEALHIISLGFIVSAVSITVSGALEGLGRGKESLYISLSRYMVVIIPAAFLLSKALGASGVWMAFFVAEAVTAVFAYWIYKREIKKK